MSTSFVINRFTHYVEDSEGFALRQFFSYESAKWFIHNKPEYKVKKIKIDLNKFEEALF